MNKVLENIRCLVDGLREKGLSDGQIESILRRGKDRSLTQDDILLLQKSQQEEGDNG